MRSISFDRFASIMAVLAGVAVLLYSVAFVFLNNPGLYSLFQLLGGLFTTAALVGIYQRLRDVDASFALWGFLMALAGAVGSAIHGGYLLANEAIRPTSDPLAAAGLPNPVDPRGLLTFGFAGVGILVLSWLITRSGRFPNALGYLGYALAVLLIVLYLGRLIIFDARNPAVAIPALLTGFIANPAWYVWLGLVLWAPAEDAEGATS